MADPHRFWTLVEPEIPWMHALLARLGVRTRDVPDVLQRALLAVHAQWGSYDAARPLRPWLRLFVQRSASDYRKRSDVLHEDVTLHGSVAAHEVDAQPLPDVALEAEERRALLLAALDTLDYDRRTVLVLVEFEGVAVAEIAAMLDLPVPTVHSRLRLARVDITAAVRRLAARRGQP
jgi:RNA polymerase sigma-70 factor (ECF subfamily)